MEKFLIFKNDKKEKDNQPDYTVSVNEDGQGFRVWGACWKKQGKNGTFLSCQQSKPKPEVKKDELDTF